MCVKYIDPYNNQYNIIVMNPDKHWYHYSGVIVDHVKGGRENISRYVEGSEIFVSKCVCYR